MLNLDYNIYCDSHIETLLDLIQNAGESSEAFVNGIDLDLIKALVDQMVSDPLVDLGLAENSNLYGPLPELSTPSITLPDLPELYNTSVQLGNAPPLGSECVLVDSLPNPTPQVADKKFEIILENPLEYYTEFDNKVPVVSEEIVVEGEYNNEDIVLYDPLQGKSSTTGIQGFEPENLIEAVNPIMEVSPRGKFVGITAEEVTGGSFTPSSP